jgi:hypothetical protein
VLSVGAVERSTQKTITSSPENTKVETIAEAYRYVEYIEYIDRIYR